jgi:hypothetical protein
MKNLPLTHIILKKWNSELPSQEYPRPGFTKEGFGYEIWDEKALEKLRRSQIPTLRDRINAKCAYIIKMFIKKN